MEFEIAKLKQQNETLLARQKQQQYQQQQQQQQQQLEQQQEQQPIEIITPVKKHCHFVKKILNLMDWKIKFTTNNYVCSKD